MRKLLMLVLVVLLLLAFPAAVHAADTGPPGVVVRADTLFGLDLVTAGVLVGVVVALAALVQDMLNVEGLASGWRRSAKLAVVFSVGVGVGTGLLHLTFLQSALIAAAAAGYYKMSSPVPA